MKKITIGAELLGANARLVGMAEKYAFADGKKGAQIGMSLDILMPQAGFTTIRVTIPALSLPITQEEIEAANNRFDPLQVRFEGFSASPYVDKAGNVSFSAKADKVIFPGIKKEGT